MYEPFKMKNQPLAKIAKAAGDPRAALRMVEGEEEKESQYRRNPDGTSEIIRTTDDSGKPDSEQKKLDIMKSRVKDGQVTDRAVVQNKETGKYTYRNIGADMAGYKVIAKPTTRKAGEETPNKKKYGKQKM